MVPIVSLGSLEISPCFSRIHSQELSKKAQWSLVVESFKILVHAVADQLTSRTLTL